MSAESVRAFLASAAPDVEIVELPASSQTHTLSAAWGIRAAQIAKTLALSVGGRAVLAVVCGDSRLDNKKVKAVLGGKATMLAPEEAATITGHVLGGVCPFGLATPMPIYCDVQLRAFDEVVPGAGSTHTALRIAPDRMAALTGAQWVDICVVTTQMSTHCAPVRAATRSGAIRSAVCVDPAPGTTSSNARSCTSQ